MRMFSDIWAVCLLFALPLFASTSENYAEALQKTMFFYNAQQSGVLSPNNQVPWRANCGLNDGSDAGVDLCGGWHDAGDTVKWNLGNAFAALTLAWSAVEYPAGYTSCGQMDELLENLWHINTYFLKCLQDPYPSSPTSFSGYKVFVSVGDGNDHAYWGGAELLDTLVANGLQRPSFYVNTATPGSDVAAGMAAAMAASAVAFRASGTYLVGKNGFASGLPYGGQNYTAAAYADLLLARAEKLYNFANTYRTKSMIRDGSGKAVKNPASGLAVKTGGGVVKDPGYRGSTMDKLLTAAAWIHRAELQKNASYGDSWLSAGNNLFKETDFNIENFTGYFRPYGDCANFYFCGAFLMAKLGAGKIDTKQFHKDLALHCSAVTHIKQANSEWTDTPGGLTFRNNGATKDMFLLQRTVNALMVPLYYSDLIESGPTIGSYAPDYYAIQCIGSEDRAYLRDTYRARAERNVDYVLGENPKNRSYMQGYDSRWGTGSSDWVKVIHHRGAHGTWAGNDNKMTRTGMAFEESRHILFGGMVAGPNDRDQWEDSPEGAKIDTVGRTEPGVMIQAGLTGMLAWLQANGKGNCGSTVPASALVDTPRDLTTTNALASDRDTFVEAYRSASGTTGDTIVAKLWNKSRWPAKGNNTFAFRYFFTLDGSTTASQITATKNSGDGAISAVKQWSGATYYVEISYSGLTIVPTKFNSLTYQKATTFTISSSGTWDRANDFSANGMGTADAKLLVNNIAVYSGGTLLGGAEPGGTPPPARGLVRP